MNQPLWGQVPQPPRQFQGFNAGGRWHPWGAPPENERDQRQRVDSTPGPGGLAPPGGASSISGSSLVTSPAAIDRDTMPMQLSHPMAGTAPPAPTPVQKTVPVPNKTPPEAKADASSSTASGGGGSMGSTPREAAALAALRRFQVGRSTESLKSPPVTSAPASTPQTPTATGSGGVPDLSNTRLSQSLPVGPAASAPRSTSPAGGHAPTLIPLYNPAPSPPAAGSSMASPSPYFAGAANTSTTPLIDPRPALPCSPPAGFTFGQSSSGTPTSFAQLQAQPNIPRHGQLPPSLSEAQLLNLDRVTRETIDERLRVLEGVQQTVWRCVEDLTRLRSVLSDPLDGTRRESSSSAEAAPGSRETSIGSSLGVEIERVAPVPPPEIHVESSGGENELEGQGKGKGKAVENGDGSWAGDRSEDADMQ
jgi:E3 ubiquitin-protein ligase synoviolin